MKIDLDRNSSSRGFTLIELLIVVAIIAILAAIAVPNFLEAQVRSKVSRALSDMRTMRTGLETYRVDNNKYPEGDNGILNLPDPPGGLGHRSIFRLTTPIAYLTTIPASAFKEKYGTASPTNPKIASLILSYLYVRKYAQDSDTVISNGYRNDRTAYLGPLTGMTAAEQAAINEAGEWLIKSVGPDNLDDRDNAANEGFGTNARVYDPTNGTTSRGDIVIFSDRPGTGK